MQPEGYPVLFCNPISISLYISSVLSEEVVSRKCPGMYCGRTVDVYGNNSACGVRYFVMRCGTSGNKQMLAFSILNQFKSVPPCLFFFFFCFFFFFLYVHVQDRYRQSFLDSGSTCILKRKDIYVHYRKTQ